MKVLYDEDLASHIAPSRACCLVRGRAKRRGTLSCRADRWPAAGRSPDRDSDAASDPRRGGSCAADDPRRWPDGRASGPARGGFDELPGVFGERVNASSRASCAAIRSSGNTGRSVSAAISTSFSAWLNWVGVESTGTQRVETNRS